MSREAVITFAIVQKDLETQGPPLAMTLTPPIPELSSAGLGHMASGLGSIREEPMPPLDKALVGSGHRCGQTFVAAQRLPAARDPYPLWVATSPGHAGQHGGKAAAETKAGPWGTWTPWHRLKTCSPCMCHGWDTVHQPRTQPPSMAWRETSALTAAGAGRGEGRSPCLCPAPWPHERPSQMWATKGSGHRPGLLTPVVQSTGVLS